MKSRLVLITEIIAPYRVPVFNALASRDDIDLHVLFLSETDPSLRDWDVPRAEIRFSYEILRSFRRRVGRYNLLFNRGVRTSLERAKPDAILCGGYSYLASWQAGLWAARHNVPLLLWIESTSADLRKRRWAVELLKRNFVRLCRAFVVPGVASKAYLQEFGVDTAQIFCAPNAIDNQFFIEEAARVRQNSAGIRETLRLPSRYFLNVGRLVGAKGVFELLAAYAKLKPAIREAVGLVFVGDGAERAAVEERASHIEPGCVRFAGFVQKKDLAPYYALADVMVFPTHTDTWGFVVNEAMACGAPVIASDVAGCVPDLLTGEVGMVTPARDFERLAATMDRVAGDAELRLRMAELGRKRIEQYSPDAWAAGVARAIASVGGRSQ